MYIFILCILSALYFSFVRVLIVIISCLSFQLQQKNNNTLYEPNCANQIV